MKMKTGSQRRTVARTAGRRAELYLHRLSLFLARSPDKLGRCVPNPVEDAGEVLNSD